MPVSLKVVSQVLRHVKSRALYLMALSSRWTLDLTNNMRPRSAPRLANEDLKIKSHPTTNVTARRRYRQVSEDSACMCLKSGSTVRMISLIILRSISTSSCDTSMPCHRTTIDCLRRLSHGQWSHCWHGFLLSKIKPRTKSDTCKPSQS